MAAFSKKKERSPQEEQHDALHALLASKGFARGEWREDGAAAASASQYHGKEHIPVSSNWRYLRFTTTRIRQYKAGVVQVAQFEFVNRGSIIAPVAATNPGGKNPPNEGPSQLLSNKKHTKWLDKRIMPLIFDFGKRRQIDGYRWATGFDPNAVGRDPVQWRLEGSNDAAEWVMVHKQLQDFPVPTERDKWILPAPKITASDEL